MADGDLPPLDPPGSDPPVLPDILGNAEEKQRVDKWLWYSRIVKTRSLAQALVKTGKVRLNAVKVAAAKQAVGRGDVLTVTLDRQIKVLRVLAPGTRRGPAPEAQQLYEDFSPPPVKRDPMTRPLAQAVRGEGAGRPTKKERRQLDRLRGE